MPLYESVFIARQDVSASHVEELADQFAGIIAEQGGEVKSREYWGLRNLSYRIKKNRKGHYVLFNIEAPSDAVHEYERNMRFNEDVLRYMTVRVNELEEGPSAVMKAKDRRDERGGRGGPREDRGGRGGPREARGPAGGSESAGKEGGDN